jgi:hypothetical protein
VRRARVRRALGPYKFNQKIADEVLKSVSYGCWMEVAAACAGVSRKTVYNWLLRGKRRESAQLVKFLEGYRRSRHLAGQMHLRLLFTAAAKGNTEVSRWYLERRYPEQFGRKDKLEHSGPGGKPIKIEPVRTSDEKRARIRELQAEAIALAAAAAAATATARAASEKDGARSSD